MTTSDALKKLPGNDPKVAYMPPSKGPFSCDNCKFFVADKAPCKKVSTPVEADGCCNLFKPIA